MKHHLQRHEIVIKEYEEAFEAYLALLPTVRRVDRLRISLKVIDTKALEKAQQRLAIAERELFELDVDAA